MLDHMPFSIGRRTEKDLVISDPRVSRDHALLIWEGDGFYIQDLNSKHGTYVNGEKIDKKRLQKNDRMEFGVRGEVCVIFDPDKQQQSRSREFLSQVSMWKPRSSTGAPKRCGGTRNTDAVPGSCAQAQYEHGAGRSTADAD